MSRRAPSLISLARRPGLALILAGLFVLPAPLPAAAAPPALVNMSWNGCVSPVDLGPASGPVRSLVISESGITEPVGGVMFSLELGTMFSGLPDAWRFDAAGCNGLNWQALLQPGGAGCPVLHGSMQPLFSALYEYVQVSPLVAVGRIRFAESFTPAAVPGTGPLTVVKFVFDQSASSLGPTTADSCGCLSRAVCFSFLQASYLDAQSNEIPLGIGEDHLTWNDPQDTHTSCGAVTDPFVRAGFYPDTSCVAQVPVPARAASWGSVKNMYRAPAR